MLYANIIHTFWLIHSVRLQTKLTVQTVTLGRFTFSWCTEIQSVSYLGGRHNG